MKMSNETYAKLLEACQTVKADPRHAGITPAYYREQKIGKNTDERFRWDMFWASMSKNGRHNTEFYNEVTNGLNDSHIDTALKRIVKELYGE